jgi:hypothetical protein
VGHVVAKKADRNNSASTLRATSGVQREHVEADHIARFYIPSDDRVLVSRGFNVRQVCQSTLWKPFGLVTHERPNHKPGAGV